MEPKTYSRSSLMSIPGRHEMICYGSIGWTDGRAGQGRAALGQMSGKSGGGIPAEKIAG